MLVQMFYWGVNFLGTIRQNRKGLQGKGDEEKPFHELKKSLAKDYDDNIGGQQGVLLPSRGKKTQNIRATKKVISGTVRYQNFQL